MERERALTVLSILLAVVVVGTVAAGLIDGPTPDGEPDAGLGAGEGEGVGSGNGSGVGFEREVGEATPILPSWLVGGYVGLLVTASAVFGTTYVGYLLVARNWRDLYQAVLDALLPFGVALAILLGSFLLSALFRDGGGGTLGGTTNPATGSGGSESVSSLGFLDVVPAVVAVIAVLFVGSVAVASRRGGGPEDPEPPTVDVRPAVPPDAGLVELDVGAPSDAAVANDVYRAWEDLARQVGATRTTTPAEVGRAAKSAGYDPEAVDELTALFRQVRYGDGAPSGRSERRARALAGRLASDDA